MAFAHAKMLKQKAKTVPSQRRISVEESKNNLSQKIKLEEQMKLQKLKVSNKISTDSFKQFDLIQAKKQRTQSIRDPIMEKMSVENQLNQKQKQQDDVKQKSKVSDLRIDKYYLTKQRHNTTFLTKFMPKMENIEEIDTPVSATQSKCESFSAMSEIDMKDFKQGLKVNHLKNILFYGCVVMLVILFI